MSYDSNPDSPVTPPTAGAKATHVKVAVDDDGQRIDNWLLRALKGIPRSRVYRLLRKGEVRVNGKRAKKAFMDLPVVSMAIFIIPFASSAIISGSSRKML